MQFYLAYGLGKENRSKIKAARGNVVHKVLEWLACYKVCKQDGTTSFVDDGIGEIHINDCNVDKLLQWSYDYYKKIEPYHDWNDVKDLDECRTLTNQALNFQNGLFDPRNRKVVVPEAKFDFEIKQPWAEYNYTLAGESVSGFLRLKGTMDLITEVREGSVYEMIDWKTGATKKDFGSGKDKDFDSLHYDPQLRLYHYAAHHLFPEIDNIMVTIYFIRLDFPCTVMLSKADLPETERMIEKQFNKVRNTLVPDLTPGPAWAKHRRPAIANYKCYKLCNFANPSVEDPSISTCQYMKEQIEQKGIQKVTEEHASLYTIGSYGTGGGRVAETPEITKD